ncbi:hypothetical protein [Saccharothrix xinjiangensis]|uniref:Syndecan 1 n=1 Tax=Saccharothrix xinjiangensis TaxID=204798 RepID=A0ABV9Y9G6_9PSEU
MQRQATDPAQAPEIRPVDNTRRAVVRPTPPRPLDRGPTLPPIAHPHPAGKPAPLGQARTSTAPGATSRPTSTRVPVPVRWPAGGPAVQRAPLGPEPTRTSPPTSTGHHEHDGHTPEQHGDPAGDTQATDTRATGTPTRTTKPNAPTRTEPTAGGRTAGRPPHRDAKQATEPDLEELARRLLDPLGRLLRAELRQGRERTGRLHDRRR